MQDTRVQAEQPRLRIVHVSDCYWPRLGGIEVQVAELARMQAAAGHEAHIVTATPGADDVAGPAVHRVVAKLPFQLPMHPRPGRHLARLFEQLAPDVVQVHLGAISPFAWPAARCAVLAGLPLVVSVHSMWDPATAAVYRVLDAMSGWRRWPIVITAVSEAAAAPIRRITGAGAVRVVPNGLDIDQWTPRRADLRGRRAGAVHVVAVGRLAPRKQPVTLLRLLRATAKRLGPDAPALRATIVGDGPAERAMRRYLRRHGMTGWVHLPGRVDRQRLPELLAAADVFLAPAEREAFGLAALEARAAGVPVVARASTGVADFVTSGRNGLLAGDDDGLVDALVRLVTNEGLRGAIAANNRRTRPIAQSWRAVLADLQECYELARGGDLRSARGEHDDQPPRGPGRRAILQD